MLKPEDKREIAKFLRIAEILATEPYANPQAAVIHLIAVLKLMNKENTDDET